MLLLPEQDISRLLRNLTKSQCLSLLSALSSALGNLSRETELPAAEKLIHLPLRTSIATNQGNTSLFMPASTTATTGIKIVTVPRQGDIVGVINVFSPDGHLTGLLSAAEITAFRTALSTMTILTRCKGLGKRRIVVFGAGKQAEWHARLVVLLYPDEVVSITFVNRSLGRLDKLVHTLSADLRINCPRVELSSVSKENISDDEYAAQIAQFVANSDVVFCCTPSTEPLFPYAAIESGEENSKFISLIGSYKPHMQEIDTETLLSGGSKVYVDSKEACLEESGEIIRAKMAETDLIAIGDLHGSEQEEIKVSPGAKILFKCVGMGIMDLAIAERLVEMARETGIGMEVDGF